MIALVTVAAGALAVAPALAAGIGAAELLRRGRLRFTWLIAPAVIGIAGLLAGDVMARLADYLHAVADLIGDHQSARTVAAAGPPLWAASAPILALW